MDRLKELVARSRTFKSTYEFGRRKFSEYHRRANKRDDREQYRSLATAPSPSVGFPGRDGEVFEGGFRLAPHPDADNPVLTKDDVTDCLARFVADPFVVYENGLYNMFFEIKSLGQNGFVGHAFSEDGLDWEYNRIVIHPETAQHTYPNVFKWDGEWLMIPSPGSNVTGEFRVYEAVDFPTEWRLRTRLPEEGVRLDPTPIYHDGTWYLIHQRVNDYAIVLKYADSLTGDDWTPHPDSPLFRPDPDRVESNPIGRADMVPSGRPLYADDGVHVFYRSHPEQSVYHYRISQLSKQSVSQERVNDVPVFDGLQNDAWNRRFMHTVDPVYPWEGTADVVAVDGLERGNYRWAIGIYTV